MGVDGLGSVSSQTADFISRCAGRVLGLLDPPGLRRGRRGPDQAAGVHAPAPEEPVAPVYTAPPQTTAGCAVNDKITVVERHNDWITLNLDGPGTFHFRLPAGKTVIEVCAGHYGCRRIRLRQTLNGEMKSGTKVEFFCESGIQKKKSQNSSHLDSMKKFSR